MRTRVIEQVWVKEPLAQNTKCELDGNKYKVNSCLDCKYFDLAESGYLVIIERI